MGDTPAAPDNQFVRCRKCGTRNPRDVTACLGCGESMLAPAPPPRRMPLRPRLLVSVLLGLLVFGICCDWAYHLFCGRVVRPARLFTLGETEKVAKAVDAYRHEKHVLPAGLSELYRTGSQADRNGVPNDDWDRPLHYSRDGTHYRITSYGADGKPGGVGLDYDLSSGDLPMGTARVPSRSVCLPPVARPTFWQFTASGFVTFLWSVLSGVVAAALALFNTRREVPARGGVWIHLRGLLLVTVAALFIAVYIIPLLLYFIPLHAPSGH